jgi:uncharacterized protein YecT (DUF1311 family)
MMRKKLWLITLISALTSFSFLSVAQEESSSATSEEQSSEALCDKYETTADMRKCLEKRFKKVDEAVDKLYNKLMPKLSKKRQGYLKNAQRRWKNYRYWSAMLEASEAGKGSMYSLIYHTVLISMTRPRIEELKKLLKEN